MLVYVNQLDVVGEDSLATVLRTVGGWLKEQTGHHFTREELMSGNEFSIDRQMVRTYKADAREPHLYGFLFSNPDSTVRGRQWITEIGVRVEAGRITVTLLLETSDISTRVTDIPVTTKPKLIRYLKDNCQLAPDTTGLHVRSLPSDEDSLRAFLSEIERPERKEPIVLLSHRFESDCAVAPATLQGHLLGLAQVAVANKHMDSWLMERELGRRYSAWGGAINIIYPSRGRDYCRSKLYLSTELEDLAARDINLNLDILSRITHFSNGYRKRQHFSPQDVRAKRAADHRTYLQEKFREAQTEESQNELLEEAFQQIEEHERVVAELKEKHQRELETEQSVALEALEELDEKSAEIWRLNAKLEALGNGSTSHSQSMLPKEALDAISNPTPEKCLQVLEAAFADRIVILESAWKSARKSETFKQTPKLADLLLRLATGYFEKISSRPDAEARHVFGQNEYAAQESETVRNNDELVRKRTFEYQGKSTPMLRHLKIGVADAAVETIRVHFHWDSDNKKIIIGYCGPHLPLQ